MAASKCDRLAETVRLWPSSTLRRSRRASATRSMRAIAARARPRPVHHGAGSELLERQLAAFAGASTHRLRERDRCAADRADGARHRTRRRGDRARPSPSPRRRRRSRCSARRRCSSTSSRHFNVRSGGLADGIDSAKARLEDRKPSSQSICSASRPTTRLSLAFAAKHGLWVLCDARRLRCQVRRARGGQFGPLRRRASFPPSRSAATATGAPSSPTTMSSRP